ncbi:MAG: hypothetical protein H0U74_23765 [Bradymonadaceae bacterium]|nr:hypothetical protein [Lujinxingiaceae bacterium]
MKPFAAVFEDLPVRTDLWPPHTRWLAIALGLLALLVGSGCASYTDHVRDAQRAIASGQPELAIEIVNAQLKVEESRELPDDLDKNRVLMLLERATLLQALDQYALSARDMMIVDQRLDWLDIGHSDAAKIARYVYSDDAGGYRAPAYERLMLNTLNMVNFLALGDAASARVEARRFQLMESYFLDEDERAVMPGLLGLGNYLAGASFEASQDYNSAVRFYARAWIHGVRPADLRERLIGLFRMTRYGANELAGRDQLAQLIAIAQAKGAIRIIDYQRAHQRGDTIILVQTGMVPYRKAHRVPIGEALAYSSHGSRTRYSLSSADRVHAGSLAARGVLTWVNFPALIDYGLPSGSRATLGINGQPVALGFSTNVSSQVAEAWMGLVPTLMAAALSRTIVRAVAGQATRAATNAALHASGKATGLEGVLGWLAGAAVEGTMAATDTPDTRSWTTLPAQIVISRVKLDHGLHVMEVNVNGRTDRKSVGIYTERLNVVNFSRLR